MGVIFLRSIKVLFFSFFSYYLCQVLIVIMCAHFSELSHFHSIFYDLYLSYFFFVYYFYFCLSISPPQNGVKGFYSFDHS